MLVSVSTQATATSAQGRLCSHIGVKRMDAQGFVSKNARIEKADRKKQAPWLMN
jgi:hypothetical protein